MEQITSETMTCTVPESGSLDGAEFSIKKIPLHDGFINKDGLNAEVSVAKFVTSSFYSAAVASGFEGEYDEYMNLWKTAQVSGRLEDWEKVQIGHHGGHI